MRIAIVAAAAAALFATAASAQQGGGQYTPEQIFGNWDKNADGGVTKEEFVAAGRPEANFDRLDLDKDGKVTIEEFKKIMAAMKARGG